MIMKNLLPARLLEKAPGGLSGNVFVFKPTPDMPEDPYANAMYDRIEYFARRLNLDLIILELDQGEPEWLKAVFDRLAGLCAPIIVNPVGVLTHETAVSLAKAQAWDAEHKRNRLL